MFFIIFVVFGMLQLEDFVMNLKINGIVGILLVDGIIVKRVYYVLLWVDVSIIGIVGSLGFGKLIFLQVIVSKLNLLWVVILFIVSFGFKKVQVRNKIKIYVLFIFVRIFFISFLMKKC